MGLLTIDCVISNLWHGTVEVGEALIEHVITKYCIPEYIIMDQDSAFMSSLMTYLLNKFIIKIKTVATYKHQSLQAEHGIKALQYSH